VRIAARFKRLVLGSAGFGFILAIGWIVFVASAGDLKAGPFGWRSRWRESTTESSLCIPGPQLTGEPGGTWYWMRSPEEEKRVVIGLYSRYCIRCHGVDGRGIWDIPNVPDFTNARWQASRSDGQLTRAILEGRGACMPPFRGTLTLEEGWAMARYLRTYIPGTEVSPPDVNPPQKTPAPTKK
jgi:hypothetical protein